MTFAEKMKNKARSLKKTLILPEGTEPRTLAAARLITDQSLASSVLLVGTRGQIEKAAAAAGITLEGITIVDPISSENRKRYGAEYAVLRSHKGLTEEEAYEQIVDPLKWGAMAVRLGDADAMVAGAENSTGNVLVAAFTIIKTRPAISHFFFLPKPNLNFVNKVFIPNWGQKSIVKPEGQNIS